MSPDHVPVVCTMSESGGMTSGGVRGCEVRPSWSVMRHTRMPVEMTKDKLCSRCDGISCVRTKSPVCALFRVSGESCENRMNG